MQTPTHSMKFKSHVEINKLISNENWCFNSSECKALQTNWNYLISIKNNKQFMPITSKDELIGLK